MSSNDSNGNSSFAAQFMRTTVAKIKRGGSGLSLPYELNWNDGVSPTYADPNYTNAAPAYGSPLARSPMATIATPARGDP